MCKKHKSRMGGVQSANLKKILDMESRLQNREFELLKIVRILEQYESFKELGDLLKETQLALQDDIKDNTELLLELSKMNKSIAGDFKEQM